MFLNDIGQTPNTIFGKINNQLKTNYGFIIPENASQDELFIISEQIEDELRTLKSNGDSSNQSPEISKRLLILEGIKTLMEFSSSGFRSPDFDNEIDRLVNLAKEEFRVSGTSIDDFHRAIEHAMKEYRSSPYRFPDDIVQKRVQEETLQSIEDDLLAGRDFGAEVDEDYLNSFDNVTNRSHAMGSHAGEVPDTAAGHHAINVLHNPELSLSPVTKKSITVPLVKDRNGRMVPDPFAAHAAQRKQGIVMKEDLVKNIRMLLETEVSQAEVMMAAKGFAQEIQEMVEKIGRLQNEDLPPVTDQMRETYGTSSASAFQTQIYGAFQGVMDALYTAKNQVDDAVESMATTGQVGASIDMDKDIGLDSGMGEPEPELDLDNIGDEPVDDFAGAELEEPLGRAKKMESLTHKINEMKRLVEKARKLREAQH